LTWQFSKAWSLNNEAVIPAQAGIQRPLLDSGCRCAALE
jgi:hypothetical protein